MKNIIVLLLTLCLLLGSNLTALAEEDSAVPTTDPSGASITAPEEVESIVVLAPSLTEMVTALGRGDQIVGCDTSSVGLDGLDTDIPVFDMTTPDIEQLAALDPDLILVTNMTLYDQENPFQTLIDLGICVACVPTSDSIADIESDITFVALLLGEAEEGRQIVENMQEEVDRLSAIGADIPEEEQKSVYFEISAAPYLYSFGSGVFLDEMLSLIGAKNILGEQEGWLNVEAESVISANPDVILTNVNYIDDPVEEILSRDGWDGVTAVSEKQVFYIDNMASSVPDQNVVHAMEQMAAAIYPDYYVE